MDFSTKLFIVTDDDPASVKAAFGAINATRQDIKLTIVNTATQRNVDGGAAVAVVEIVLGFAAGVASELVASLIYDAIKNRRARALKVNDESVEITLEDLKRAIVELRTKKTPEE